MIIHGGQIILIDAWNNISGKDPQIFTKSLLDLLSYVLEMGKNKKL